VLGDAAHRWSQLAGATPTIFTTGTDEHGLKIQKAAEAAGIAPQQLCDSVSGKFKRLFDTTEVSSTDYVRTTENRHVDTVHKFWNVLREGDHIYKGKYGGWYSVPDETFLSPSQVTDGTEPGTKVWSRAVVKWGRDYLFVCRFPWRRVTLWSGQVKRTTCSDCPRSETDFWNGLIPDLIL
jgi:methionyl-tRNA synthetase